MITVLERLPPILSSFISRVLILLAGFWFIVISLSWNLLSLGIVAVLIYSLYIFLGDLDFSSSVALRGSISGLPSEYKTAAITALLTIAGFIVAFRTATSNWRQQMLASLKAEAAGEIEGVYSEASRLITSAEIFSDTVIRAVDCIQSMAPLEERLFSVQWVIQNLPDFVQTRNGIAALSVHVHRLVGKHALLLTSAWGAQEKLNRANEAFGKVAEAVWVPLPYLNPGDPKLVENFFMQVSVQKFQNLIQACQESYDFINMASGAVRGQLLSPVVGLPFPLLISSLRNRRMFREYFSTFSKKHEV
jgi:hypothetical protein